MTDSVCFIGSFPVPTRLSTQCISTDLEHAQTAWSQVIWRPSGSIVDMPAHWRRDDEQVLSEVERVGGPDDVDDRCLLVAAFPDENVWRP